MWKVRADLKDIELKLLKGQIVYPYKKALDIAPDDVLLQWVEYTKTAKRQR